MCIRDRVSRAWGHHYSGDFCLKRHKLYSFLQFCHFFRTCPQRSKIKQGSDVAHLNKFWKKLAPRDIYMKHSFSLFVAIRLPFFLFFLKICIAYLGDKWWFDFYSCHGCTYLVTFIAEKRKIFGTSASTVSDFLFST